MSMNMFKKKVFVRYRDITDPTDPFRIIQRKAIYKMVWDMKKIGFFSGVFAVVIALLATTAMFAFRGGQGAGAVYTQSTDVTTTTVVEENTTTTTEVFDSTVARHVCDMPLSLSGEYYMKKVDRIFNPRAWVDNDVTIVFEWVLPDEYDQYMPQFKAYVDRFSVYTGIKTQVIKGYDETASDIWGYEWDYIYSQQKIAEGEDSSGFYQSRLDAFLAKYDTKKIGVNVVLDDVREDGAVGWVEMNNLKFGITLRAFEVDFIFNGKEYTYWDRNHGGFILHELGHVIGLGHTHVAHDGIDQEDSIMSYETSDAIDYYLPGDIAAMQEIFCMEGAK